MRHPTEGVLRRLLDEPLGVTDADREHVTSCEACRGRLAAIRGDAELVHAALAEDGADVDVAAAWQRLSTAASTSVPVPAAERRVGGFRAALRRPAVAGVVAALVLTGAGAAAAFDWLQIFRTERIAPISLDTADLNALPDLRAYGRLVVTGHPDVHEVMDAAAAAAETGLDVPEVISLPQGVTGEPTYQVGGEASATFTFSADRTAQTAAQAGEALPPPPRGLDGTQIRLVAGPGVAQIWASDTGVPSLVVGRAVAPSAFSSTGVPFETVRDYLLSLPGVPDDVAAALRALNAGSTLPLPVPAGEVSTSSADVQGARATVLEARDRTMAAVLWVEEGVMTVVAGSFGADEALSVAQGLR